MPMGATTRVPTYLSVPGTTRPALGLWKVTVTVALTALSLTSPVSGSIPEGTSTAILGAGDMFMRSMAVA